MNLPEIIQSLLNLPSPKTPITLDGDNNLTLTQIAAVARSQNPVEFSLSPNTKERLETVHQKMLEQIKTGIPIYGTTSAYGGQAGLVLNKGHEEERLAKSRELSQAIIHVDVSTGDPLPQDVVRAAMLIRVNMLLPGYSALRLSTLELYRKLLNSHITPVVGRFGTVGASGDLAQNGRVLSVLLQHPTAEVFDEQGQRHKATDVLPKAGFSPLELEPKEGLGLVNGDNFSTASAALITFDLTHLMLLNLIVAALNIQALKGSTRNFHPLLSDLRPHPGQEFTASVLRKLLTDSQLSHQEMTGPKARPDGEIIQDSYSIRCLPQFFGPDWETLTRAWETIRINANSVSDNPLWTTPEHVTPGEEPYQWVSGGNFLAMHMSETLDQLRKIAVHMVKQNDRHLARMIHPFLSNGLPANLSDPDAVSQCTFKGLQTQMGMMDVYATVLATPVSTAFGTHEELNQDITSHAMTSAIMTWEVLKLTRLSLATNLIASCQAVDLRGGPELLSPATKPFYDWVRSQVPYIKTEQPLGQFVEQLAQDLTTAPLQDYLSNL